MFEKFIVAFIGTLILCAVAAAIMSIAIFSFTWYGLWGIPICAVTMATTAGLIEMLPKTDAKP